MEHVLACLRRKGQLTLTELQRTTSIPHRTLHDTLEQLERQGCVTRVQRYWTLVEVVDVKGGKGHGTGSAPAPAPTPPYLNHLVPCTWTTPDHPLDVYVVGREAMRTWCDMVLGSAFHASDRLGNVVGIIAPGSWHLDPSATFVSASPQRIVAAYSANLQPGMKRLHWTVPDAPHIRFRTRTATEPTVPDHVICITASTPLSESWLRAEMERVLVPRRRREEVAKWVERDEGGVLTHLIASPCKDAVDAVEAAMQHRYADDGDDAVRREAVLRAWTSLVVPGKVRAALEALTAVDVKGRMQRETPATWKEAWETIFVPIGCEIVPMWLRPHVTKSYVAWTRLQFDAWWSDDARPLLGEEEMREWLLALQSPWSHCLRTCTDSDYPWRRNPYGYWDPRAPVATWHGVVIEQGAITQLTLDLTSGLNERAHDRTQLPRHLYIPASILRLPQLVHLNVKSLDPITVHLPSTLAQLPHLQYLYLFEVGHIEVAEEVVRTLLPRLQVVDVGAALGAESYRWWRRLVEAEGGFRECQRSYWRRERV